MQQTAQRFDRQTRWTHARALERRLGLPRGMLLSSAVHGDSTINSVLSAARLDGAMLDQLARILAVTVREWLRR